MEQKKNICSICDGKFIDYFSIIPQLDQHVIVSVGSGCGVSEYKIQKKFQQKVFCIEPFYGKWCVGHDHTSSQEKNYLKPDFKTIQQFCHAPWSKDSEFILLIEWPFPFPAEHYDFEAIEQIDPKYIFVIWSTKQNTAASPSFHRWFFERHHQGYTIIFTEKCIDFQGKRLDVFLQKK